MYLVAANVALPFGSAQVYNIITMCYLSGSILDCLSVAHLGVFGKISSSVPSGIVVPTKVRLLLTTLWISDQARGPAEFKHIIKRRKRN